MLQPIMFMLQKQKIVLASGSPRRKYVLELLGFPFEVKASDFEENLDKKEFEFPHEYATKTALLKATSVADQLVKASKPADLVIGADTVVTLNDKIYEKPRSRQDAVDMLTSLSGTKHTVITGMALISPPDSEQGGYEVTTFHEATDVVMGNLSSQVINAYIDSGEPMDKAGGYGIQGFGANLISGIHGDYYNVVGFPLYKFSQQIIELYKQKN